MNGQQLEQSMRELEIHLEGRPVYCMVIKVGEVYRFEEATAEEIQTRVFRSLTSRRRSSAMSAAATVFPGVPVSLMSC